MKATKTIASLACLTLGLTLAPVGCEKAPSPSDAAAGAAAAAKAAVDKVQAEGSKWITDTAEKQWPEVKKTLESLAAKASSIPDPALKSKAQALLADLQAKVPQIENAVAQIKNYKVGSGDPAGMLAKAKELWATFESKLSELKGLVK
jgi:hypothetical protein